MKHKIFLFTGVIIAVILLIVALIIVFANSKKEDAITQKETALKIGKALLEEHFPDTFLGKEIPLEAEEHNGIWWVSNVVDNGTDVIENGNGELKIRLSLGGGYYVEFRKNNGKIIKIGVND